MPANGSCTNEEKLPMSLAYNTAAGNPAAVDGDSTVIVVSGDGTFERTGPHAGFLVSGPAAGDTIYLIEADADLGEGIQTISDTVTLTVAGAPANTVGITLGAAVLK